MLPRSSARTNWPARLQKRLPYLLALIIVLALMAYLIGNVWHVEVLERDLRNSESHTKPATGTQPTVAPPIEFTAPKKEELAKLQAQLDSYEPKDKVSADGRQKL
jgi:cell division protein FtsI/penicillin-binding protein 2